MRDQSIFYLTQIVEEPFTVENGTIYNKTAIIETWKGQLRLGTRKLAVPDLEKVYQDIAEGKQIDLSNCYLKDFSLRAYRKKFNLEDSTSVTLDSFHADHSFFESEHGTDFSHANFEGHSSSFANTIFNLGKVSFNYAQCETNLNFNRAEFNIEELSFKFAEFEEGDIRFSSAFFNCRNIFFINTNFGKGNVTFRQADFAEGNCSFQYARFDNGDVNFDKAVFRGKILDFRKVEFGTGKVDFKRVDFGNGDVNFSESEFKESKISFRSSIFGSGEKRFERLDFGYNDVVFDGCIFKEGMLSFKGSMFKSLSFTDCFFGGETDFRVEKGELIDLTQSIIKDIIDFQAGQSEGQTKVDLKTLKIEGVKNMGKMFIGWKDNNAFELIASQADTTYESKANQFHLLKESFHQNGKYNSEDYAYVAFKRYQMKAERQMSMSHGGMKAINAHIFYGLKWLVFDKAGLFATSPLRVFTSMLFVLSFFALLFCILPYFVHAEIVSSVGDPDHLNIVEKSFYHSAITFFTIGYGDFYPSGHVRWLSAVEGWSGVFLMSYFTVAFVRRILR